MRIKVCGVQTADELGLLDRHGVDYAGVWWKLAEGARNVGAGRLTQLCAVPRVRTRIVLVTIGRSAADLAEVLSCHGIGAVQLAGFELPPFVSELRRRLPALRIFKTLHVKDGACLQAHFIDGYAAAGVAHFVLDSFVSRTAIGSTGVPIDPDVARALARRLAPARAMLAGGVDAPLIQARAGDGLWGVDVDTAARAPGGGIGESQVAALLGAVRSRVASAPVAA